MVADCVWYNDPRISPSPLYGHDNRELGSDLLRLLHFQDSLAARWCTILNIIVGTGYTRSSATRSCQRLRRVAWRTGTESHC